MYESTMDRERKRKRSNLFLILIGLVLVGLAVTMVLPTVSTSEQTTVASGQVWQSKYDSQAMVLVYFVDSNKGLVRWGIRIDGTNAIDLRDAPLADVVDRLTNEYTLTNSRLPSGVH